VKSDHLKRVNLKDVAKEAQTSVATVSKVLNDSGYCSDEIRIRVQKAVEKLGYQPNLHANFAEVAVDLLLNYIQNPAELDNRPYPSKSALN
jgi:DNA-binding LacI/PurR family transcriptional regulator